MKRWIVISLIVIVVLIVSLWVFIFRNNTDNFTSYKTAPIQYGNLISSISATGTVEPEELIDVGAQVAGRIVSFGKDKNNKTIDYGSAIEEDNILAKIDDSLYYSDMLQAKAQVLQAKASLQKSEADLEVLKAKYELATNNFTRAEKLRSGNVNSQADYDSFKSEYQAAKANVDVGTAVIDQSKAQIAVAESVLRRAQQNLDYCTIKSPVNGVVIDRRVNIGQTVVASLSAPSLFLIAKDLKRMEVWVTVNEADIGKIQSGQDVTFTVDAYPGANFTGKVTKVRFNASVTQNVVTYIVVVSTDNSKGKLLPYLTANVQFEVDKKHDVFMVPNASLRWMPEDGQNLKEYQKLISQVSNTDQSLHQQNFKKTGIVWIFKNDDLTPIQVTTGISNDIVTEIENNDLKEGMEVVTALQSQKQENSSVKNPFLPQFKKK